MLTQAPVCPPFCVRLPEELWAGLAMRVEPGDLELLARYAELPRRDEALVDQVLPLRLVGLESDVVRQLVVGCACYAEPPRRGGVDF